MHLKHTMSPLPAAPPPHHPRQDKLANISDIYRINTFWRIGGENKQILRGFRRDESLGAIQY